MFNIYAWFVSIVLWAGSIMFAMGCWSLVHGADSIGTPKFAATFNYNLTTQYAATVQVQGGNGGPRNYVGLFADSSPTAVRLDWFYLDGTKTLSATRNLTVGSVTFAGLVNPNYEIRLFNWTAVGVEGTPIATMAVNAPQLALERRTEATEGKPSVQRVPFGNRDQVKVILDSGVQEITTMDRGIEFKLVDVSPAPVVPVSTVP